MKRALPLLLLLFASACATVTTQEVPAAAKAELAPTGKLRAALLAANPNFVRQDTPPGVTRGIAVEIAERLAKRLQVPMVPVLYPSVAELVASAGKDEWDITFLVIDPERAEFVNFTAPYMYIESTFMVPAGSTAEGLADLDRSGKTVAAAARGTQEKWLRANAKSATLVSASSGVAANQMLREGKVDAVAGATSVLTEASRQIPGSRVLPGSFVDSQIGMGIMRRRPAALAYAYEFVDHMKANGEMEEVIAREKLVGVRRRSSSIACYLVSDTTRRSGREYAQRNRVARTGHRRARKDAAVWPCPAERSLGGVPPPKEDHDEKRLPDVFRVRLRLGDRPLPRETG
jgi:polar amino acid transport system substrate-binding protein